MVVSYPKLGPIVGFKYPQVLLGHDIYWTLKEDGSNIGCYLDSDGELQLRSRNQLIASPQFYKVFEDTGYGDGIKEMLLSCKDYGDEYVVFGELLTKGKSPTRIEYHDKHDYIIFDIWSEKMQRFLPYNRVHQESFHAGVPCTELLMVTRNNRLNNIYSIRDDLLVQCKERKKEGVVGKIYTKVIDQQKEEEFEETEESMTGKSSIDWDDNYCFFKEKLDSVHYDKVKTVKDEGGIVLPELPDSEIFGAIDKVYQDIDRESFNDVKTVMPKIAYYVKEECTKHHCINRKNLMKFYLSYLQDREDKENKDAISDMEEEDELIRKEKE